MKRYIEISEIISFLKNYERFEIVQDLIKRIANLPTIEVSEDCISREWLFENYQTVCATVPCSKCPFDDDDGDYCRLADLVMNAPSVVPSRAEGEWKFKKIFPNDNSEFPMGYLVCSVCGSQHANATPCNYCDNCGAKMESEE